jgi:hypothetical protein
MPRTPESFDTDLAALLSNTDSASHDAVNPIPSDGAPEANEFADGAYIGRTVVDTATGDLYICTATNGTTTATWGLVGSQGA